MKTKKPTRGQAALQSRIRDLEARIAAAEAVPTQELAVVPTVPVQDPRLLKLDLACGQTVADGYQGVDLYAGEFRVDLCSGERWPWEDATVDALRCSHFIEHIPMTELDGIDALVWFFNETFRVAKPGAVFELTWPALQNVRAFMDPTHRRFIPIETMFYLSKEWRTQQNLDHYLGATCDWILVSGAPTMLQTDALKSDAVQAQKFRECWNWAQDHVAVLRANKPAV